MVQLLMKNTIFVFVCSDNECDSDIKYTEKDYAQIHLFEKYYSPFVS